MTPKQKKFVEKYIETGNGTKSVLEVYDTKSENVAANIASENLRKPKVQAYLEEKSERAAQRVFELMEQDENRNVALGASKDILDRAGLKPIEEIKINSEIPDEIYESILKRIAKDKSVT